MRTRAAKYADVMKILAYCKKQHELSDWATLPFDTELVRNNLVLMVRTLDTLDVIIAEDEDRNIRGVLLATTDQFFFSKAKYASDMHFVADGGGVHILSHFARWARERKCTAVIMAVSTTDAKAEDIYDMAGFQRVGGTMVYWIQDVKEKAA